MAEAGTRSQPARAGCPSSLAARRRAAAAVAEAVRTPPAGRAQTCPALGLHCAPTGRAAILCTVGELRIDPEEALGIIPACPLAYWGWGVIPDQYGRRWDDDDGESPMPKETQGSDLPPIGPWKWLQR